MTHPPAPARSRLSGALWLILALCIARLWIVPLWSSFWVDEMGTAFVVRYGASHPTFAVAPQVPQSIYYWLPRFSQWLCGLSEPAYRIPSVLVMALALWLISLAAARLIHPRARWFAVFAALGLRGIDYHAADARPYALGICLAAAGLYSLVRWLDSGRGSFAAAFILSGALLWRVQLIYWPFYLVFVIYAAVRLWRRETRVPPLHALLVFGAVAAALVPVALSALSLFRQASAHVMVVQPSLRATEHLLRWNLVLICAVGAWLTRQIGKVGRAGAKGAPPANPGSRAEPASTLLVFSAWLIQPFALYAFSHLTGDSVFLNRYLSIMLPGIALAATWAAARFLAPAQWKPAALVLGIGVFAVMGQWTTLWPPHEISDWRAAARTVNAAIPPAAPVICPSPFIEARWPIWRPDYPLPGFLYAHLAVYPLRHKVLLFPYESSPEATRYATSLLPSLTQFPRFAVYGGAGNARYWRNWFAAALAPAGWTNTLRKFGDVYVAIFQNPAAQPPPRQP